MTTRALLLPVLLVSLFSSAVTLAAVLLAFPPSSRADAAGQPPAPVVRAQRFEVADASGTVLATLGVELERSTGLFILDASGQQRAGIAVGVDGLSFVQVFTPQGAPQFGGAIIQAHPDGTVWVAAVDQAQPRAELLLAADSSAGVRVVGTPGGPPWQAP